MVKHYPVIIKKDSHGIYYGVVPTLRGCYTQGGSPQEVMQLLENEVIPLCEEVSKDQDIEKDEFIDIRELTLDYA